MIRRITLRVGWRGFLKLLKVLLGFPLPTPVTVILPDGRKEVRYFVSEVQVETETGVVKVKV